MTSTVAIVGRPNVGKSTLFNRLSRSRDARVDNQPGITRDRLYASVRWGEGHLTLVDTGGFHDADDLPLMEQVRKQVDKAVAEADRIILMVDGRQGIMPGDEQLADLLRRSRKPFFVAVNKVDGPEQEHLLSDFYTLGVDKVYPLSAAHGYGLRTLMDEVAEGLSGPETGPEEDHRIRVAILGRPNAGKSSLINRVLGFERLLVSELPGTTRDAVDILLTFQGKEYLFIDTAGLKRKARVKEKIEKFSMIKTLRSLERCHLAVILLDGREGVGDQDARICGYALERGRGVILGVNKWDLIKNDAEARDQIEKALERQLKFAAFAPRINLSALTGEGLNRLFGKIDLLYGQFDRRIGTGVLNRALGELIKKRPPPKKGQGRLKFFYATQTGVRPPTFVLFVNRPEMVHFSYQRFLTNQLRMEFDLRNTPIKLIFNKK